jgi:BlaI family transcriptional regulator, penicillinase repressor
MTLLAKLSRREREITDIVFAMNQATLSEILERMEDAPTRPALRSILTILERKGHLHHTKAGREFVYSATREKQQAGQSALRRVLDVFFGGSLPDAVAAHLASPAEKLDARELADLELLIAQAARRGTNPSKSTK